ncbi:DUF5937 family protein [Streptomyces sp. NPDC059740]|uniref:DUF5937 family protein n=1 Tax=Streptomyces sp. NPDC059740 TaxID=3346926 RepID=UPI00364700D1
MHIDITGLPPERIRFELSPLAEMGAALHVLSEPGHHPGQHGWATATRAALKPDLADRLLEVDFLWTSTFSDLFMPGAGLAGGAEPPGATLAEELDLLDRLDDAMFTAVALEFTCSSDYDTSVGSPLTDRRMRERSLELAAARGPRQLDFTRRLLNDPPAVRAWVRRLLEDCDEVFFGDVWQRMRVQLAADARHKAELLQHRGLAAALADVSEAVALSSDGTSIVVDKLAHGTADALDAAHGVGLSLMPSAFNWPHVLVLHRPRWRPVIQYPATGPGPHERPSLELVAQRLEALAHPVRMRLCRAVARTAFTTGELAGMHDLTAPEVSRHLAVLKRAQLLTTRRRGRYVLYQLDPLVVARLGSDFLEGILR